MCKTLRHALTFVNIFIIWIVVVALVINPSPYTHTHTHRSLHITYIITYYTR
ncbi:hypothetical protein T492DRAFT_1089717 [Pavlovales sp. CCMP2436]|nr:hypothetical protein T492DRAFT_1089717 [Pavlovales sp. CCMP2436]